MAIMQKIFQKTSSTGVSPAFGLISEEEQAERKEISELFKDWADEMRWEKKSKYLGCGISFVISYSSPEISSTASSR